MCVRAVVQRLERYGKFWDEMDDVDANCVVLDPDPGPLRRAVPYRRIALGTCLRVGVPVLR